MKLSVFGLCTWKQILTADEMPGSQVQFFWKISVHNMHSLFSGINVKLRFLCFTLNYHLSAFSNFLLQEILGLWDSPKWNIICKPLWRDPGTQKCSVIDHLCYFPSLGANHTFWPCLWIMALIICVISKHVRTGGQQLCSGQSTPTVGHPKSWGRALAWWQAFLNFWHNTISIYCHPPDSPVVSSFDSRGDLTSLQIS